MALPKTQFVHEFETIKTSNAIKISLHSISSLEFHVHVGQMIKLVNFLVLKRLDVPAILR